MSFFKPSSHESGNKKIARLHALIWTLIYGGLLMLVLGISVERTSYATGWPVALAGGVLAAIGFFLIYVRSKIQTDKR